jgi:integrase
MPSRTIWKTRWTAELHLRSYKTAKHYDEFVQELPPALAEAVAANVEAEAAGGAWRKYLFQSKTGRARPLTDNTFGRRVTAAFQRLTGVPIGASNLRKAFVSHLLNTPDLSQEQLGLVARRMMHSENTQRDYRRVDIRLSLQRLVDADGGAPAPDDPRCDPAGAA